jgi:hypothetical protein
MTSENKVSGIIQTVMGKIKFEECLLPFGCFPAVTYKCND